MSELIQSTYAHYLIFGGATLGLAWGAVNALFVSDLLSIRLARAGPPCIAKQSNKWLGQIGVSD